MRREKPEHNALGNCCEGIAAPAAPQPTAQEHHTHLVTYDDKLQGI